MPQQIIVTTYSGPTPKLDVRDGGVMLLLPCTVTYDRLFVVAPPAAVGRRSI